MLGKYSYKGIQLNDDGSMVLLAAGQVAVQPPSSGQVVFRGARSGNAKFDPVTGKFAGKSSPNKTANPVAINATGLPQGLTKEEYDRRRDVVRDAARQKGTIDADTMTTYLKGRVADLSLVNVQQFVADVREARLDDLADALQSQYKGSVSGVVKISAPAAYFKNVFRDLSDQESASLIRRLFARGWSTNDIKKNIVAKVTDPERKAALEEIYGQIALSEEDVVIELGTGWNDWNMDQAAEEEMTNRILGGEPLTLSDLTTVFSDVISKMPPPVIHFPEPKKMKKVIIRDEVTGLPKEVVEVPDE